MQTSNRRRSQSRRRGATTVEFAIVAPLLFGLVLAGVEFSRANLILHTCHIAAVEGARSGIVPGATVADCEEAANAELTLLGVNQATITVTPSPIRPDDDTVTVQIDVPLGAANGFLVKGYLFGKDFRSTVTLSREVRQFGEIGPIASFPPPPSGDDDDDDDDD
ncbi:MAG: TadE family protein [Planctomycetota bacterium]